MYFPTNYILAEKRPKSFSVYLYNFHIKIVYFSALPSKILSPSCYPSRMQPGLHIIDKDDRVSELVEIIFSNFEKS